MTPKLFSELGLSEELLKAIDKLGFEQAAPIQAAAIPVLMAGKDVVGQSQTGSGKTAAFGIPAIEKVEVGKRAVQILILCPTRELAVQVSEEVHKLAFFKRGLHALPIYGGQSYDRQLFGLRQGAHIVIGTPGRIMDHMRRGTLKFDALKMVILDEVDVMLNMGFRDDIELILQATPKERQTVVFSATIPRPIQQLIEKYTRDPQQVRIEQTAKTVPTVEQFYYEVDRRYKIDLLTRLIDIHDLKLGIIFCNTKRMVDDLVDHLNAQGYSADRLHGDMSQMMRDRVMNKFRKSGLEFLVATDVAARGIDVDDVEVVFNYDLPYDGEDYVHRIGRTGRKGRKGRAISFASGREVFQIRNIERYTNMRIQRGKPPTVGEVEEARANVFLDKLRVTLKGGEYKRHDHLIERLLEEGFASTDIASALIHQLQGEGAPAVKPAPRVEEREDRRPEPQPFRAASEGREQRYREQDRPARAPWREERPARRDDRRVAPPAQRLQQTARPMMPSSPARPPVKPPRVGAPITESANPQKPPATGAPVSDPARLKTIPASRAESTPSTPEKSPPPAEIKEPVSAEKAKATPTVGTQGGARHSVRAVPTPSSGAHEVTHPTADSEAKPEAPRTYSDREILASVPPETRKRVEPRTAPKPKVSRATPANQTRLWMSLGEEMGVVPIDIVNTVAGETGLPGKVVGTVDIRERHLFVDVASEHANSIIAKLNRTQIKGHKVKVKVA